MGSSVPTVRFCVEAGPSYACLLRIDGSERARWTLSGRDPAELLDAFEKRYVGGGADDGRSGPESLDELARLCRDCLPGPLIDQRRPDHLEERLKAAGEPGAPPLVLCLEVGDELRDLPFEAGQVDPDFEREGVRSVCLDDRVVVARRGSGPGLVADSELRVLVVDCGDEECLTTETLKQRCGETSRVTVLACPTYAELTDYLTEEHDHNVLVTIGHVARSGSDKLGLMTFRGAEFRPCEEVASLVARSLPELKVLVLGGCESWSSLAPAFEDLPAVAAEQASPEMVLTSIPVLVGHHFKVAPATERRAVKALLRKLAASGCVDVAFRAYRAALGQDDVCEKAMRCSAVLRLKGESLELVTRDTDHRKRLRYARSIRAQYSRVRLPGDAKRDVETLRSRGGYLEREVSYVVGEREQRDGPDSAEGVPSTHECIALAREHEVSIVNRLLKGRRSVVGLKAPAGVGKTALVHNVAYRLATDYLRTGSGPLPVCVELRGYGTSLKDLVARSLAEGMTVQHLEAAGYVLLADGLDEAVRKDRLRDELKALPNTPNGEDALPPPSASLVSSRPGWARSDLPHFGLDREGEGHVFELQPWDLERVRRYVAHHFEGVDEQRGAQLIQDIKANPALVLLAAQPLLLWILCAQVKTTPVGQLPRTATALLGAGIGRVLRRRNEHLEPGQRALGEADLDLIAELCWANINSEKGLTVRDAWFVLLEKLQANTKLAWEVGITGVISRIAIDNLLQDLVARSGLLTASGPVRADETVLSPSDVRFGEFLVAKHLARAINGEGWAEATVKVNGREILAAEWISTAIWNVDKYLWIAALCCGQLADPCPLLAELSTYDPTPLNQWGDDEFIDLCTARGIPQWVSMPRNQAESGEGWRPFAAQISIGTGLPWLRGVLRSLSIPPIAKASPSSQLSPHRFSTSSMPFRISAHFAHCSGSFRTLSPLVACGTLPHH